MSDTPKSIRDRNRKVAFKDSRYSKQHTQDLAFMRGYLAGKRHDQNSQGSKNPYQNQRCFHAWFRGWEFGRRVKSMNDAFEYVFELDSCAVLEPS